MTAPKRSAPPETGRTFTPTADFEAEVNGCRNRYLKGFSYTIRPGNDALAKLARGWEKKGRIAFGAHIPAGAAAAARARGTGTTTKGKR